MLKKQQKSLQKTSQFKTQCKGDISHAFETAKMTVFYPTLCKTPDVPLQINKYNIPNKSTFISCEATRKSNHSLRITYSTSASVLL